MSENFIRVNAPLRKFTIPIKEENSGFEELLVLLPVNRTKETQEDDKKKLVEDQAS